MARLYVLAVTLNIWVLVGILTGAFSVQFWLGDPPCPLCVMQRIAFMLVGHGLLHTLLRAPTVSLTSRSIAVGQGMAIISALLGALAASRQILLPGDPGFGSPVFRLHLYTWCWLCHVAVWRTRSVAARQELLGRCDCGAPRAHRRGAKRAVRLGGSEMTLDVEGVVDGGVG